MKRIHKIILLLVVILLISNQFYIKNNSEIESEMSPTDYMELSETDRHEYQEGMMPDSAYLALSPEGQKAYYKQLEESGRYKELRRAHQRLILPDQASF